MGVLCVRWEAGDDFSLEENDDVICTLERTS